MKPFEIVEHTAEIGIRAYGRTLEELFANMAAGMFSLIVPPDSVRPTQRVELRASAQDRERLLLSLLRELIVLFDTRGFLANRFSVSFPEPGVVAAVVEGEPLDRQRHPVEKEVKAATYCDLRVEQDPQGIWTAQVIFDI